MAAAAAVYAHRSAAGAEAADNDQGVAIGAPKKDDEEDVRHAEHSAADAVAAIEKKGKEGVAAEVAKEEDGRVSEEEVVARQKAAVAAAKMAGEINALVNEGSPWGKHAPVYKLAGVAAANSMASLGEEEEWDDDEDAGREEEEDEDVGIELGVGEIERETARETDREKHRDGRGGR